MQFPKDSRSVKGSAVARVEEPSSSTTSFRDSSVLYRLEASEISLLPEGLILIPRTKGGVVHICNPNNEEAEAGGSLRLTCHPT